MLRTIPINPHIQDRSPLIELSDDMRSRVVRLDPSLCFPHYASLCAAVLIGRNVSQLRQNVANLIAARL